MTKLHDITIETIKEEISKTQKQDREEMEQKDIELEMEEKTREKRMRKNSNDNNSSLDTSNKPQDISAKLIENINMKRNKITGLYDLPLSRISTVAECIGTEQ